MSSLELNFLSSFPDWLSQMIASPARLVAIAFLPSFENKTLLAGDLRLEKVRNFFPLAISHRVRESILFIVPAKRNF